MSEPIIWDIEPKGNDGFKAHLRIKCARISPDGFCRFSLWKKPAANNMWQWDGVVDRPTISPSIACNGGCGRHFTMIAGEPK